MIPVPVFKDCLIAVLGLGKTGISAAKALQAGGAHPLCWDDAPEMRQKAFLEQIPLKDLTDVDWSRIKALILSPGIPHFLPFPHPVAQKAAEAGVPILSDIELLYLSCPEASYLCVTGSNGKSTTTALIGHLLKSAFPKTQVGGNIGEAVLNLTPLGANERYVLELSSYQLERVPSLSADTAVFLNISPDHIDRHGSLEGYVSAKKRIFETPKHQRVIIGVDDPESRQLYESLKDSPRHQVVPISCMSPLEAGVFYQDGKLYDTYWEDGRSFFDLTHHLSLQGAHNGQNAAAAYAAARMEGLSQEHICLAMETFEGLPHRMEFVGFCEGVRFVNDSKATNAEAASKALGSFEEIYWILGGRPKEGGLEGLDSYYSRVRHAYVIGEAAALFEEQLKGKVPVTRCENLDRAVSLAFKDAQKESHRNPVVLLSPACASLDQFKSFEHRGDVFRSLYRDLVEKTTSRSLLTGTLL